MLNRGSDTLNHMLSVRQLPKVNWVQDTLEWKIYILFKNQFEGVEGIEKIDVPTSIMKLFTQFSFKQRELILDLGDFKLILVMEILFALCFR